MAEVLTKLVVNCETGEQTIVPLTEEEIAQREIDIAEATARRERELAEIEAKAVAKASAIAKLTALGLTEDEVLAL